MKFLNKMERKFGRYAVRNLSMYIVALYVAGYLLQIFGSEYILDMLALEPYYIMKGQIWRLVTWILVPPDSASVFTIITLFFYYSIGNTLERTWGSFRYNVYIFSGMISTVLGAFILYFVLFLTEGVRYSFTGSALFSTYYINMSIFLAFAVSYPNMEVLLYFFIPIKMKWMGFLYGFFVFYSFIQGNWVSRVAILASLLNFVVFFLMTRNYQRVSPHEIKRKREFHKQDVISTPQQGEPRHRCAICGRTELDGDHLEFRYCSKCEGNYEYCQDHLFTHEHVRKQ